eukprot:3083192-Ditylum_brightwellii.AAC.1
MKSVQKAVTDLGSRPSTVYLSPSILICPFCAVFFPPYLPHHYPKAKSAAPLSVMRGRWSLQLRILSQYDAFTRNHHLFKLPIAVWKKKTNRTGLSLTMVLSNVADSVPTDSYVGTP